MKSSYYIWVAIWLILAGCDLPTEPGPMPNTIIDTEYVERLNIMGILRLDGGSGNSFIYVQRTMTTEEIYTMEADPVIRDAFVTIADGDDVCVFQHSADTLEAGMYRDSLFIPLPGHTYELMVTADELPILTAGTTVPGRPQLNDYSVAWETGTARFDLALSRDTFQYMLYLQFPDRVLEKTLAGDRDGQETVVFSWDTAAGDPVSLTVTGMDENLTRYQNSSISFIPNTYHKDESTVENGFGCFGSVAVTTIDLIR